MGTELSVNEKIDNFKVSIVKKYNKELLNYFMQDEKKMMKFMSWVIYSIQKVPSLLNDVDWLMWATLELAQLWISPGITQEAYILPFKGKATAMIWYQWFVNLLYKAWITSIQAEIVREKDLFKNILWLNPNLIHEVDPRLAENDRGDIIGCYVVVKLNWESIYKYMSKNDILEYRKYSQSYKDEKGRVYSPWNENNDPQLNMWKKTVFKQLVKYLPKNELIAKAIEIDNEEAPIHPKKDVVIWGAWDLAKLNDITLNNNIKANEPK